MELRSSVFEDGGEIPSRYAYRWANEIPPLEIRNVPPEARSLLLILEDLDSPLGSVTHWIVWNLPPDVARIDVSSPLETARVGTNGYGKVGYDGPAPPVGRHRYRFLLMALDRWLTSEEGAIRQHVEQEASGSIIAEAVLMGYFESPEPWE